MFVIFFGLVIPDIFALTLTYGSLFGLFFWGAVTFKDKTVKNFERYCGIYVAFAIIATFATFYLVPGPAEGLKFNLFLFFIITAIYISTGFSVVRAWQYAEMVEKKNNRNS